MAEEKVLRLGVDPRPGEEGFKRFEAAAEKSTEAVDELQRALDEMGAAQGEASSKSSSFADSQSFVERNLKATREAADALRGVRLEDAIEETGTASGKTGKEVGRLSEALGEAAEDALGLNHNTTELAETLGGMALSGGVMVGVMAGLAALQFAWNRVAQAQREAREEQDKQIASLEALRQAQEDAARGPAGATQRAVEVSLERQAELVEKIATLQRQADRQSQQEGGGAAALISLERAAKLQEELDGLTQSIAAGETEVAQAIADANTARALAIQNLGVEASTHARILEATQAGGDALANVTREIAREMELRQIMATMAEGERDHAIGLVNLKHDLIEATARQIEMQRQAAEEEARYRKIINEDISNGRLRRIEGSVRDREASGKNNFTDEFLGFGFDLAPLRELPPIIGRVSDEAGAARLALISQYEANRRTTDTVDEMVSAIENLGGAFGDVGGAVGGFAGQFVRLQATLGDTLADLADQVAHGLISQEQAQAAGEEAGKAFKDGVAGAAAGGFAGGVAAIFGAGIGNFINQRREEEQRQAEIEAAQERFGQALDDFVSELTDRNRFEQLRKDAMDRGQGLADAFSDAFADVLGSPVLLPNTDSLDDFIQNLPAGQPYWTPEMQQAWQRVIDSIEADLARVEEQRQREVATMENEIAIRGLVAQGKDDEADALRLQVTREAELARARELEDEALITLLQTLYDLEDAALAAAEAAAEEAEAKRRAQSETDFLGGLSILQAENSGDPVAIAQARGAVNAAQQIADARELFEDGIIDQPTLDAFIEAVGIDFTQAVQDASQAVYEAIEAEEYRLRVADQSLELRALRAQGLDEEYYALQNLMEIERARRDGFDEDFIAQLRYVQGLEEKARLEQEQIRALDEQARATKDAKEAAEDFVRVFNGPRGVISSLALTRSQVLRGTTDFGVGASSPSFGGAAPVYNIDVTVNAAEGMSATAVSDAVVDKVIRKGREVERAGGANIFTLPNTV